MQIFNIGGNANMNGQENAYIGDWQYTVTRSIVLPGRGMSTMVYGKSLDNCEMMMWRDGEGRQANII